MKKKFKKFLKEHNAWKKFKKNFKKWNESYLSYKEYLRKENPYDYIGGSFTWNNTKQGGKFWDELDDKWHEILKS